MVLCDGASKYIRPGCAPRTALALRLLTHKGASTHDSVCCSLTASHWRNALQFHAALEQCYASWKSNVFNAEAC